MIDRSRYAIIVPTGKGPEMALALLHCSATIDRVLKKRPNLVSICNILHHAMKLQAAIGGASGQAIAPRCDRTEANIDQYVYMV
jgi:hypothetical protein